MKYLRPASQALKHGRVIQIRTYSNFVSSSTKTPPQTPRHLLSIADLTSDEFRSLIQRAASFKAKIKVPVDRQIISQSLRQQTVAMMFNKRSTRTRVSTEAAVQILGGHPMFLGKDDIQLGVNESLYDTSKVISSMVSCMVARVGPHSDIEELARHSSVPVINALSEKYHPLQTIADFLTMYEAFPNQDLVGHIRPQNNVGNPFKIAWVGDANNVLFDLAIGAMKLGVNVAVAAPKGYEIPEDMREIITSAAS